MLAAPMTRDPRLHLQEPGAGNDASEGCGADESADPEEDGESVESEDSGTDIPDPDDPETLEVTPGAAAPRPPAISVASSCAGGGEAEEPAEPVELTLGGGSKRGEEASAAGATDGSAVYDASMVSVYSDEEDGTMSVARSDGALGEQLRKLIAGADSLEELLAASQPPQAPVPARNLGVSSPGAEPFDQWMPVVDECSPEEAAAAAVLPSPEEDDTEPSDNDGERGLPLASDTASSQEEEEEEEVGKEADGADQDGASSEAVSSRAAPAASLPGAPARSQKASDAAESAYEPTVVVESEVGQDPPPPARRPRPPSSAEARRRRSRSRSRSRQGAEEEDPEVQRRWRAEEELWRKESAAAQPQAAAAAATARGAAAPGEEEAQNGEEQPQRTKKTAAKRKAAPPEPAQPPETEPQAQVEEEEEPEGVLGEGEALALAVEAGPEAAEEAIATRAKRRRAAAAKAWKELSPRLLCLRDFVITSCSEQGISYAELIRRLYHPALTKPVPSVSLSTVSRIPVSFKVSGTVGAKSKSRGPVVLRVQRPGQPVAPKAPPAPEAVRPLAAKVASPPSKIVVVDEEPDRAAGARGGAEEKGKAEAYESRTAPLALLRAYVSQERPVLFRQGAIIFEDDRVQYPGSTLTPVREHEDGGALLNLSSLWLLGVLRGRYQAAATKRVCEKHGAVRINGSHADGLLSFLLGKKDECKLIVVSERLGAVPFPIASRLKTLRSGALGVRPPLTQQQLQQLPGCEDDEKAVRSVAELLRARAQVEASLRSLEKKRKELEEQLAATSQEIGEASRQRQKLDAELATAQGRGDAQRR